MHSTFFYSSNFLALKNLLENEIYSNSVDFNRRNSETSLFKLFHCFSWWYVFFFLNFHRTDCWIQSLVELSKSTYLPLVLLKYSKVVCKRCKSGFWIRSIEVDNFVVMVNLKWGSIWIYELQNITEQSRSRNLGKNEVKEYFIWRKITSQCKKKLKLNNTREKTKNKSIRSSKIYKFSSVKRENLGSEKLFFENTQMKNE